MNTQEIIILVIVAISLLYLVRRSSAKNGCGNSCGCGKLKDDQSAKK